MNAYGHDRHVRRRDVHDRVFPNCQHEHVRENGHGRVHGYERSQSRDYAGTPASVICFKDNAVSIDSRPRRDSSA